VNKRPIAVISVFFILGIVLARTLPLSIGFHHIFIITTASILSSFMFSRFKKTSNIFLSLSVIFFAALLYLNSNFFPDNHIGHFLGEEKLKRDIVGIIKSPALTRRPYYGKINSTYLFEIEGIKDKGVRLRQAASALGFAGLSTEAEGESTSAKADEWYAVNGLGQIRIQREEDYQYGDRLLVTGTIRKPPLPLFVRGPASNKGFNYREYLERQNIFAVINTKENNITVLSRNYKSNPILRYTYLVREKLKNRFIEKMPLDSGAFLRAILLGDRSELPKHIQHAFKNSGTMHILAISGLHVGIIALVIIYLLRVLRIRREFSYIVTILFLIFFALLTLSRPSVLRAVVMACIFLIGMLLGRRVDVYNSLGIAGLFILIRNPKDLFNVGFQLSFLAVIFIVYLVPRFMKLARQDANPCIKKYLYMPLAVSISAWLGTAPLILYYFRIITPIAIVANVFIIPLLFILLIGGLVFLLFGWMSFLGSFLAGFNELCAHIIFFLTDFFSSLRFGHFHLG